MDMGSRSGVLDRDREEVHSARGQVHCVEEVQYKSSMKG